MPTLNKTIDELLIEYQLQLSELEHVVIKIAQEVGLDKLILSFPDGYKHVIVNSERVFSGTDRVKLLVARALIDNPKMVFSEDLFSGLRDEHSKHLLNLLLRKCKDKTLVIVSNSKQIIKECDNVLELK
jgi:ABC-type transport system involved in cytochrome bd biosynthesis fused ATPase/permease subunit